MLDYLRNLLNRRRQAEYRRGFDFASGALLRGEATPATLEGLMFDRNAFDDGVLSAIERLVWLRVVPDDRCFR